MVWDIVLRRIGRAGGVKQREARQRQWDREYGEGVWAIGYVIDGDFVPQEDALQSIYYRSYEEHFRRNPADLHELLHIAKERRNPHAEATTGVDLQVPAIEEFLQRHSLRLDGDEVVDIGTWQGQRSHGLSERLSPLQVRCVRNPKITLEKFWQSKKCLAVWTDQDSASRREASPELDQPSR
ncbi:MAG: hypothetical protein AAF517_16840 [Planctomycetota bacterium]